MDGDGHRGEVKVIEEHRQMVVKALRGCEIQLQRPEKGTCPSNLLSITGCHGQVDRIPCRGRDRSIRRKRLRTDVRRTVRKNVREIRGGEEMVSSTIVRATSKLCWKLFYRSDAAAFSRSFSAGSKFYCILPKTINRGTRR